MRELDLLDIIGIMVISIGVLILTPILLYSLYTFDKIKDSSDLIKYRNKRLVYAMNILSILSFCTESVFIIMTQVLRIPNDMIPEYICFIAVYLFIFGFNILFIIKTWLSYYLSAYHSILVELAWSKDENPKTSKSVNNEWFIKYKHKLGDYKYLIKIGFIPFLLLLAIQIVIDIEVTQITKAEPIVVIIPLLCTLLIFIVLSILYCKMFNFNDIYQIKKEIQYQTTILLLIILINLFGFIAHFIAHISDRNDHVENHDEDTNDSRRMEWLVSTVINYISLFSISLISTAFPVYLYKKNLNVSQLQHNQSIDETNNKKHHFLDGMLKIISNEHGYKAFMVHLIKEYSTENMWFIHELCQIKYNFQLKHGNVLKLPKCIDLSAISTNDGEYKPTTTDSHTKIASSEKITVDFNVQRIEPVSQNHTAPKSPSPSSPETMDINDICVNFEDIRSNIAVRSNSGSSNNESLQLPRINTFLFHDTGGIFCKLILPGNLPQSAIINTYSNDLCKQMECLCQKYIFNNSKHEINISYKPRIGLVNLFENNVQNHIENEFDMFNIFDEAAIEILKLAFNSFSRFIETVSYNEVKEKIKNDKHYAGISNVSADFDLEAVHSEESYHKICDLYPTNSGSLQSVSAMTIS